MDRPGLLERSDELGGLHGLATEMAATGQGGIAVVSGEAGVGKTALLRQFRGELPRRVTALWGSCDPLFTPRPLGPLLEPAEDLTNRKLEVLPLLAQGLRNAEIAQRLVVTPKTVDHHVSSILRKLGVGNRGQAAAAWLGVIAGDGDPGPVAS